MEVQQYYEKGNRYQLVISRKYAPLRALRDSYMKDGYSTWINLYDMNHWQLTVQMTYLKEAV